MANGLLKWQKVNTKIYETDGRSTKLAKG